MRIDVDDLTSSETIAFLEDHVTQLRALTPPESTHALDLEGLRAPGVVFWSARDGDRVVGCAALKTLDDTHAEVKSMRTAADLARRGHRHPPARHGHRRTPGTAGSAGSAWRPARSRSSPRRGRSTRGTASSSASRSATTARTR